MSDDSNGNPYKTAHPELFNVRPLVFNPRLATLIGLEEAIILQQVKYWIEKNTEEPEKAATHLIDGRWWTYNTIAAWKKQFPFWSYNTVKRTIAVLEKKGILVSGNHNKDKFGRPDPRNRTKWYTINYDAIPMHRAKNNNALAQIGPMGRMGDTEDDYGKSPLKPSNDALAQIGPMQELKLGQCYTEIIINEVNNNNLSDAHESARDYKDKATARPMSPDWRPKDALRSEMQEAYGKTDKDMDERDKAFVKHHIEARTERISWDNLYKGWYERSPKTKTRQAAKPKGRPKKEGKTLTYAEQTEAFKRETELKAIADKDRQDKVDKERAEEMASKPYLDQLKDKAVAYLYEKEKLVSAIFASGINDLRFKEINGNCLTVEGRIVTCEGRGAHWYAERLTDAVRALEPKVEILEFQHE